MRAVRLFIPLAMREPRVDGVGDRVGAIGQSVRLRQLDAVGGVDAHDAGEPRCHGRSRRWRPRTVASPDSIVWALHAHRPVREPGADPPVPCAVMTTAYSAHPARLPHRPRTRCGRADDRRDRGLRPGGVGIVGRGIRHRHRSPRAARRARPPARREASLRPPPSEPAARRGRDLGARQPRVRLGIHPGARRRGRDRRHGRRRQRGRDRGRRSQQIGLDWPAVGHVILTHMHPDHAGSAAAVLDKAPMPRAMPVRRGHPGHRRPAATDRRRRRRPACSTCGS